MIRVFLLILTLLAFYLPPDVSIARDAASMRGNVSKIEALPKEAQRTLALIKQGGPFPYQRDGIVFGNFEWRLPVKERGYYKEYTVPTPGARDRGAGRIIAGRKGEYFYTADHYRTFRRIRE